MEFSLFFKYGDIVVMCNTFSLKTMINYCCIYKMVPSGVWFIPKIIFLFVKKKSGCVQ